MAENVKTTLNNNEKRKYADDPTQDLLQNIHDMIVKNQSKQEEFNEEVLEKLRDSEAKSDKQSEDQQKMMNSIDEMQMKSDKLSEEHQEMKTSIGSNKLDDAVQKPENNSFAQPIDKKISSDKIAIPPATLPASGKAFELKHVFKNVLEMKEDGRLLSEEEECFGVPWKMSVSRKKEHLSFYLHCTKPTEKWSIDVSCKFKLVSNDSKTHSASFNKVFDTNSDWGWDQFIEWDKMKEDFVNDGKLNAEVHVKINKMDGIYKDNLRNFDQSMGRHSDVVLIVRETKFYVSKLYLATHSPYFDSLFFGQFQESNKSQIKLSGIDSDDFQNYLEVLYGEKSIDETTVEGIILISDMYDTPSVIRKCEDFLIRKSEKKLKKMLELSIRYNLKQLKKKCVSEIKTVDDIRSVLPGVIHDMDHSITADLLEKLLELQQQ